MSESEENIVNAKVSTLEQRKGDMWLPQLLRKGTDWVTPEDF